MRSADDASGGMISIDGAGGEGGGQILRTALALSARTTKPFRIERVRARRAKPGLLPQHLAAVRAAAMVCGAAVEGDLLGSDTVVFEPGPMQEGAWSWEIGTAGSACLVLQTVLWPMLAAPGTARVRIGGGTHNPASPPFHFLEGALLPVLDDMGADIELSLDRWGFYPAGGGRIIAIVRPGPLRPVEILERGAVLAMHVCAAVSDLPEHIARREITTACRALGRPLGEGEVIVVPEPRGMGNAMWIEVECEHVTEVFTGFGQKGLRAEIVAAESAAAVRAWLDADVPVGPHLADQLVIPMALAGGGAFRTGPPTPHLLTQIELVPRFLGVDIRVEPHDRGVEVRIVG